MRALLLLWTVCLFGAEVYFSPADHLAEHVVELIEGENERILIAAYDLSHRDILQALIEAKQRGVKVEIVVDEQALSHGVSTLLKKRISVYEWQPPSGRAEKLHAIMHDKFCVFGTEVVWTGSYNFSYKGDVVNRENGVVLRGEEVAELYAQEFKRLKQASRLVE